jgi:hypothetical protein
VGEQTLLQPQREGHGHPPRICPYLAARDKVAKLNKFIRFLASLVGAKYRLLSIELRCAPHHQL